MPRDMTLGEALHLAIPRGPHITREHFKVTKAEFDALPVGTDPVNLPVGPYTLCKVKIDGRWHACQRQYQMGVPVYFAAPITILVRN
jgi:hypothetical protein